MDHAQRGAKALSASDFRAAIQDFTRALVVNPHAPDYYIKRSTAYSRLKPDDGGPDLNSALHDAEMAVSLGIRRARREQIVAGQMRRGVVLYQLGRVGDANHIFGVVRGKVGESPTRTGMDAMQASMGGGADKKSSKDGSITQELDIWEMKVKARLAKAEPGAESVVVTVKETPDIKVPDQEELKKAYQAQLESMAKPGQTVSPVATAATSLPDTKSKDVPTTSVDRPTTAKNEAGDKPAVQPPTPSKIRHEWYQSSDTVTVTLYAKGVPKEKADIEISEHSLTISFPLPTGSEYSFTLDPFFAPVDVSSSKYSIMSTKIEVLLRKQQAGQKWGTLEGTAKPPADKESNVVRPAIPATSEPQATASAPAYPTSSRKGAKDWDKVASSLSEKKKKKESNKDGDAQEGGEDDADSDFSDYSGDPVDGFFKKLYAGADPDTRRAMMKSFYESEGTALSTNWSDVGKKKVEVHPPSED